MQAVADVGINIHLVRFAVNLEAASTNSIGEPATGAAHGVGVIEVVFGARIAKDNRCLARLRWNTDARNTGANVDEVNREAVRVAERCECGCVHALKVTTELGAEADAWHVGIKKRDAGVL